MKSLLVFAFSISCVAFSVAQDNDFEWEKKLTRVKATVKFLEDKETVVIVPDGNENMRYISRQLPEEYKKERLRVTFSGWKGKIPPHVRMLGTPLKITCICISGSEQKKYSLKRKKYVFS